MAQIHRLRREQIIRTTLEEAWDFIRSPANLDRITPPDMGFHIVGEVPCEMFDGLLIEYRITLPMLGKRTWLTEIKHVRPRRSFVDEQRAGPYKFWSHYHEITPQAGGVRFVDEVTYALPLGLLGALAHAVHVRKELNRIFDYRGRVTPALLEAGPGCATARAQPAGSSADSRLM